MNREQAVTLVEFNAWANRRLLGRAALLEPAALRRRAPLSFPTAMATLVHILDTQWYWGEALRRGELPLATMAADEFPTLAALRKRWDVEDGALLDHIRGLTARQLNGPVRYAWPRARPRTRPAWQILLHIVNHSTQHRSELAAYLTSKKLSPGNLDFIRFASRRRGGTVRNTAGAG